ncbi:MAG: type II secretion system protein GspG [Verrucomicrobiales bacterium]|nr:type II secretion system protein GspG [Verrucomicrobiales bacterium]
MKKAVVPGLVLVGTGFLVFFLIRNLPSDSPGSTGSGTRSENGDPAGTAEEIPYARAFENPDRPIVGRKPYDTGITNDRRVQTTDEGKHVVVEAVQIAESLHSPDSSIEEDLDFLEQILSIYRLSFEQNPVAGDNQMVMEALLGGNPRNLVVFPSDHPAINAKGELLDRWGNPYFFHALSGTEMEIFSAGPDGVLNTADDVQRSDRSGQPLTGAEEPTDTDAEQ